MVFLGVVSSSWGMAAVVNIANDYDSGTGTFTNLYPTLPLSLIPAVDTANQPITVSGTEINEGYFISGSTGGGSGNYRTLFRMQGNNQNGGIIKGYNRIVEDDLDGNNIDESEFQSVSMGPSSNPFIRRSDLVSTPDGRFYVFSFDANESGQDPKLISVDNVRIYAGPEATLADPKRVVDPHPNDVSPLPNTLTTIGDLGALRWEMNEFGSNTVIIEAGGSGVADMFLFVPTSRFAGVLPEDLIYLYAEHGAYSDDPNEDFTSDSGFEEWSIPVDEINRPPFAPVPEPSVPMLGLAALGLGVLRRSR